jgi:hypothetical protein
LNSSPPDASLEAMRARRRASFWSREPPPPFESEELEIIEQVAKLWMETSLSTAPARRDLAESWASAAYVEAGPRVAKLDVPFFVAKARTQPIHWPGATLWCGSPAALIVADIALGVRDEATSDVLHLVDQVNAHGPWFADDAVDFSPRNSHAWTTHLEAVENALERHGKRRCMNAHLFQDAAMQSITIGEVASFATAALAAKGLVGRVEQLPFEATLGSFPLSTGRFASSLAYHAPWSAIVHAWDRLGVHALSPRQRVGFALAMSCPLWLPRRDVCLFSDRPELYAFDEEDRPHGLTGPAIRYRDGFALYAAHGVRVREQIIMRPDTITVAEVDAETNAEARRVMIDRMTPERFLRESGAQPIHADETGELYRRELVGDEPLQLVRVVNATPEPDGSKKIYWLRVPPDVTTAREAVAWTFGLQAGEYVPEKET